MECLKIAVEVKLNIVVSFVGWRIDGWTNVGWDSIVFDIGGIVEFHSEWVEIGWEWVEIGWKWVEWKN